MKRIILNLKITPTQGDHALPKLNIIPINCPAKSPACRGFLFETRF
jgi:hypothetical protein